MKNIPLLMFVFAMLLVPIFSFGETPIESEVLVNHHLRNNPVVLESIVTFVKDNGYRCNSISAADMLMFSNGYDLACNNFAYKYILYEKGGKWFLTVK